MNSAGQREPLGQRGVELRTIGEQDRRPHLGHELGPQQLDLLSSASCSWKRHRLRSSLFVDQSVSSNARRAASMARSMSSWPASATWPSTSSVAGFTLAKRRKSRSGVILFFDLCAAACEIA